MKNIIFLLALIASTQVYGTNTIKGKVEQSGGTAYLMKQASPFDENVQLIGSALINENGEFKIEFELEQPMKVLIKVGEAKTELLLSKDSDLELSFKFEEVNLGGRAKFKYLNITSFQSSLKSDNELYELEQKDEILRDKLCEKKRPNKKYASALYNLIKEQMENGNPEFAARLTSSSLFSSALHTFEHHSTQERYSEMYDLFVANLKTDYAGIEAVSSLHGMDIRADWALSKKSKIGFLDYADQRINEIESERIRDILDLRMTCYAYGSKYANPERVKKRLNRIAEHGANDKIRKYAQEFLSSRASGLIGQTVKDFELSDLSGKEVAFSDYRGKYLLIDFWATWCGPCIKSMRKLPGIKESLDGRLEVLCITMEQDQKKVMSFVKRNGYRKTLDFAMSKQKELISSYFDKQAIPLYFLISPEGTVLGKALTDPQPLIDKHLN